jgi:hypothetical protein
MASGETIPETERLARGQVAVKLRLDSDTLVLLDDLVQGEENRQSALRRLIREAAARLTKPKRSKPRKAKSN